MFILLLIIAIIASVLLGAIVLIQNPKGGGLSSNFSSSSQLMGVKRTGDFLEKATWGLAILLMVISLAMNIASKTGATDSSKAEQIQAAKDASKPTNTGATQQQMTLPAAPAGTGATQPAAPKK
ncbi:MAG: preprotein translocase subunit SecG [Mucilaginibacter sp.]